MTEIIFKFCRTENSTDWGRLRSELALFESAATWYTCQLRSAPAVNRTRHVGSVKRVRYRYAMSQNGFLTIGLLFVKRMSENGSSKLAEAYQNISKIKMFI